MPQKRKEKLTDEPAITVRVTEATDDWLRAARLQVRAEKEDKDAAKELERMEATPLVLGEQGEQTMDYTINFDYMPKFVLIQTEGEATAADHDRLMKQLTSAPEWKPGTPQVVDHRKVDTNRLSFQEMTKIREIVKKYGGLLGKGPVAFVVESSVLQGFSNMYALIDDKETHADIGVFSTSEEAVGWVRKFSRSY